MFWADEVAQKLKERNLPLEWVDDMKTPSGRIHVGSLLGVVVHDLVYKSLKEAGVGAKYTYVFENHDPMDDIPSYLPREKFEQYLGMPLFKIPSPVEGYKDFAEYYAMEFQKTFETIGCHPEILWTKDLYTSGKMNAGIKTVLDNKDAIRTIYKEMYKKEVAVDWYPFQVYCEQCGKVSTTRVYDWDGKEVSYRCLVDATTWTKGCGFEGKISPYSDEDGIKGKMPWKVEWAVKWQAIGVTVEGAGKDHMSRGGSHDLASLVSEQVLHYPVPYPVGYEFILIGGKKMSSSKGRGFAAADMLTILPPELVRFLFVLMNINRQTNFDPSEPETIPKLFDEYQKTAQAYIDKSDQDLARVFELSQILELKMPPTVRFSILTQWVQMPNMESEIKKNGLEEWAMYAKIWVEKFAPESEKFLVQKNLPEAAKKLSEKQKEFLSIIAKDIDNYSNAEKFQKYLYEKSGELNIPTKDAFKAIYVSFIGKDHGPKAGWLILSLDKEFVQDRLREVSGMSSWSESETHKDAIVSFQHDMINKPEIFSIDKNLAEKFPSISVGIAIIKNVSIQKLNPELEKEKNELLKSFENLTTEQLSQYSEIESYRKLYKITGVDWHSRRPSPEALLRRVALKKGLYNVNTCVDAYNLIVMKHRISIGAFDLDKIQFPTILRFAKSSEEIHLLGDQESTKYKDGEIAYFDKIGGFNMDFNYRDAQRTAVQLNTKNLYVNVDGVYDITSKQVEGSLKEACDMILRYCGGTLELFGVETPC